jgi:hypothetical protein
MRGDCSFCWYICEIVAHHHIHFVTFFS